ncbi:MAG: DUF4124 domain-containing protein [Burkholderiales bacterium]|nr:DUF4124 domain-containing protein [Burkholderiales bacterium]
MQINHRFQWPIALLALLFLGFHAYAQKPVYRCETAGRVSYSNEPCVGAREIDATPTQGMDKMTGVSRKGADVRRDEYDTAMANAVKPLTGMTPDQFRVYRRRSKLSASDQAACTRLDGSLPQLKQRAASAPASDKARAEVDLYKARKRFNDLNC